MGSGGNSGSQVYRIKPDGSEFEILHTFGISGDGDRIYTDLAFSDDGKVYGTTVSGGLSDKGIVFSIDLSNKQYQVIHQFSGGTGDGEAPRGLVLASDGSMYGVTNSGGSASKGIVFKVSNDVYSKVADFPASFGNPTNGLVEANGVLWGTCSSNSAAGSSGALYSFDFASVTKVKDLTSANGGSVSNRPMLVLNTSLSYQDINFPAISDHVVTEGSFNLSASVPAGGSAITFTSSNPAVATVSGNTVTLHAAGNTTITANATANGTFFQALPVSKTLTVKKLDQTITFNDLNPIKYSEGATLDLTATASSQLAVSYSSSDAAVASVSGSTLSIHKVGTVTITARQAGNANVNPATEVSKTLVINKGDQTITFNAFSLGITYGDGSFSLSASASSGLPVEFSTSNENIATVAATTLGIRAAGTATITAKQIGSNNFNAAASVSRTLTIEKKALSVKVNDKTRTYGTANPTFDFVLSGFVNGEGSGVIAQLPAASTTATMNSNAGTYAITASGGTAANYSFNYISGTLTITKASQSISFDPLSDKEKSASPFQLSATATSGLIVAYASSNTSVATINGNTVTIVGAGTCTITASQAGDGNHEAASSVSHSFSVKEGQTITFGALVTKTATDAAFTLEAIATSGLPVSFASSNPGVATVNGNVVTLVGGGTTDIVATQSGNSQYIDAVAVKQTLTVSKADQVITFNTISAHTENDAAFQLNAGASSGLPVTYTVVSGPAIISASTLMLNGAGSIVIIASQPGNSKYNAAPEASQTFCSNPSKPVITASFANPEAPVLTSSKATGNQWFLNGSILANATGSKLTATNEGSYTVQVTVVGCSSAISDPEILLVTGIDDEVKAVFGCFPNPAHNAITITWPNSNNVEKVAILDVFGRVVKEGGAGLVNQPLYVMDYAAGLYVIKVSAKGRVYTSNFIKK